MRQQIKVYEQIRVSNVETQIPKILSFAAAVKSRKVRLSPEICRGIYTLIYHSLRRSSVISPYSSGDECVFLCSKILSSRKFSTVKPDGNFENSS